MKKKLPLPVEEVERLERLKASDDWPAFADLAIKTIEHWRLRLSRFSIELDSVEKIAKDRIRWTSMIAGVEALFSQMDDLTKALKENEESEDE